MGWVVSVIPQPCFTPRERTPGTYWIGGWVGLITGLDTEGRGKIVCLCLGSNPGHPICSQTSQLICKMKKCSLYVQVRNRFVWTSLVIKQFNLHMESTQLINECPNWEMPLFSSCLSTHFYNSLHIDHNFSFQFFELEIQVFFFFKGRVLIPWCRNYDSATFTVLSLWSLLHASAKTWLEGV
jgi:hypothetical protein